MKNENYWKQFMASGRVEDYLSYAGKTKERDFSDDVAEIPEKSVGEYPYAGFMFCDRDGVKPDTCR